MMGALPYDAVVLLGFGGPETPQDVRPFLSRVLAGRPVPPGRIDSVAQHYADIGGTSPFNALTARQASALERALHARSLDLPVRVAYRFADPYMDDVVRDLANHGARRVLAIVLAAHRSSASTERYAKAFEDACEKDGNRFAVEYTDPFFDDPLFVRAHAQLVHEALAQLGRSSFDGVELIFTAHSIPQPIADAGSYVSDLTRSAELIAREAGAGSWRLAYQSRSGKPTDAWLEPDVRDVLRALAECGVREAMLSPIGFLCDHVEVLYDLDVDAVNVARESGVRLARASALNDHPLFIELLAERVASKVAAPVVRP